MKKSLIFTAALTLAFFVGSANAVLFSGSNIALDGSGIDITSQMASNPFGGNEDYQIDMILSNVTAGGAIVTSHVAGSVEGSDQGMTLYYADDYVVLDYWWVGAVELPVTLGAGPHSIGVTFAGATREANLTVDGSVASGSFGSINHNVTAAIVMLGGGDAHIMEDVFEDWPGMTGLVGDLDSITIVPEPATMMLLGLGALALLRRRG
jgi:hypothetical protein